MCNRSLVEVALTGGTDTSDLLGGFEQVDLQRSLQVGSDGGMSGMWYAVVAYAIIPSSIMQVWGCCYAARLHLRGPAASARDSWLRHVMMMS